VITNTGKTIIGKYLLGQAPAFASYIAVGCGPKPRLNINSLTNCSTVSLGTTVTTTSTAGLWIGALVSITAGTGSIPNPTFVASITDSTHFILSVAPTVALSGATMSIEIDKDTENLDFEMFRVPISSRGYVQESGLNKIVLTAELPTEERYEITEVGLYSAGSNPSAGTYDSKTIFAFTNTENWQYHTSSATTLIPTIPVPLDSNNDNIITGEYLINVTSKEYDTAGVLTATPVFQANSDNSIFYKTSRANRYERCRFLNNTIFMQGDRANLSKAVLVSHAVGTGTIVTYTTALPHTLSIGDSVTVTGVSPVAYNLSGVTVASVPTSTTFTVANSATGLYSSGGSINVNHFIINTGSNHIHVTGVDIDFTKNSPIDELRLAFSLVSKNGGSEEVPDTVRILVDFSSSDTVDGEYARFEVDLDNENNQFQDNRYYVVSKQKQDLYTSANFNWNDVSVVKIYASVIDGGALSSDYYVALDAMRLENIATENPLYGLTGYTIIQNTDAETIIKSPNTNNYIEFRFSIGVS
jgi:hypothetical protein